MRRQAAAEGQGKTARKWTVLSKLDGEKAASATWAQYTIPDGARSLNMEQTVRPRFVRRPAHRDKAPGYYLIS
jgi:hypothetical protein